MASPTLKKKPAIVAMKEGDAKEEVRGKKKEKGEEPNATKTTTTTNPSPTAKEEPTSSKETPSTDDQETCVTKPPTFESVQEENAALRTRIAQLQSDLQDAQDFVFSLQPRHKTLTESEAIGDFTALCAAIEEWVDLKLGDALEEMSIADDQLRVKDIGALMDLIPPAGKAAFNILNTDQDLIQAAILRYLNDAIFSQEFYCPLPPSDRQFVLGVERSMRSLTPKRDVRSVRHWRIETYTAAIERPGFNEYANERMSALTIDIIKILRVFAPGTDTNTLAQSFYESITKPACALARKMHLCFDEYTLEWSVFHDKQLLDPVACFDKEASDKEKFTGYEFVDMNSRKILRDRPTVKSEDGKVQPLRVKWMFDLSPKLVFRKLKADSWTDGKVLVKPKVLVAVSKQTKEGKRLKKEEVEDASVLGALAKWLHRQQQQARSVKPTSGFHGFF
ncbi:uncharacterized protein BDV17DRAFT_190234 [Aspergillus undulatus]|uniref:uncharacterized protein n=1 Tax=Aspergillus undulatus TaxID=1810928 RepID=UPI003CCD25FD